MKVIIDDNHDNYDTENAICFRFSDREILKRYKSKYSYICYDDNDPDFIFVKGKRTCREYYQELGYGYEKLKDFFKSLMLEDYLLNDYIG